MDELVDFEELIDLNLSLPSGSQKSSQEPIADVLDRMCQAMGESNFTLNNTFDNNINDNDEVLLADDIVNLDAFENLLPTESLFNDESNLATDAMVEINEKNIDEMVPNDDVIDLDAFENLTTVSLRNNKTNSVTDGDDMLDIREKKKSDDVVDLDEVDNLLATAGLCYEEIDSVTDDISQINEDVVKMPVDVIDLDEIESISANACLFIDNEDTPHNSNNVGNVQRVQSYEFPVEFENACANTTECGVVTSTNKYSVHKISVETTALRNVRHKCIDLDTFEFGTANSISNKLKNNAEEPKMKITEDIVTLTINDNEVKYDAVAPSEIDCKNAIDAVTEDSGNKTDSDDGYNSSDFEFISEQEASKAGIFTRIIKKTKMIDSIESTVKNVNIITQHNQTSAVTNNIDNRPRKNEANFSDYVKYSKYRYMRCYAHPASEFHELPQGERYLDMFRGEFAPEVVNNLYSLRNKRVLPAVAMAANFEDLACRDVQEDEINKKDKEDAEDCLQKIVSTYPDENRKRRRH